MIRLRLLFISFLMVFGGISLFAQQEEEQIDFCVIGVDPSGDGPGYGKSPLRKPSAWQADHEISFHGSHADYVLNLVDEDGTLVYTTYVPSALSQVSLPASLSGDYEIQLIYGNWMFYGYITL